MKDTRFDRVYILKTQQKSIKKLKGVCDYYQIETNGIFEYAKDFHIAWGFSKDGLIYLSPTTFLTQKIDFYSVDELIEFLEEKTKYNNA